MRGPGSSPPMRPAQNAPFHPHGDTATYRDLLLFEERLKMNAEMLRRRRRRYNVFLWTFILATLFMGHHLVFNPPKLLVYLRALQGALAVVTITLVLFFASGMFEEKIRYAYAYLAHSNKVLRPLNMHLNTRRPPLLSSLLSYLPTYLRPTPSPQPNSTTSHPQTNTTYPSKPSPIRRGSTTVVPSIPPSSNPRGELIFSSRVDRGFREGYERYRAAFERRREEKERMERAIAMRKRWSWLVWWWRSSDVVGPQRSPGMVAGTVRDREGSVGGSGGGGASGRVTPTPPCSRRGTPPPGAGGVSAGGGGSGGAGSGAGSGGSLGSVRGRERSSSPSGLRKEVDVAGLSGNVSGNGNAHAGEKVGGSGRERAESYSFVWTGNRDTGPLRRAP